MTESRIAEQFARAGYAGPLRVLSKDECRRFLRAVDLRPRPALDREKGLAAAARAYYEIATRAARYVVFELHGRTSLASGAPGRMRATLEELVTPRHWKRRLKGILGR